MQGKQAKMVRPMQERAIVGYLDTTRYPSRDRGMFLLSIKAGLRAKEIAGPTWAMVTDAAGQIAKAIQVPNRARKGKIGGRTIPMHPDVHTALVAAPGLARRRGGNRSGRCSSRSVAVGCRQRRCACGSIGSLPR